MANNRNPRGQKEFETLTVAGINHASAGRTGCGSRLAGNARQTIGSAGKMGNAEIKAGLAFGAL
jgi:hypothetical protein